MKCEERADSRPAVPEPSPPSAIERELGASLLIFGVVLALIYTATSRVSWVIVGLVFFVGSSVGAYYLFAHVQTRVQVWLDPTADYLGTGYQVSQSLFGLGTGGLAGTGLAGAARIWCRWPTPTSSPPGSARNSG
jgi:cell division protein FtsW (lipid II flippase)